LSLARLVSLHTPTGVFRKFQSSLNSFLLVSYFFNCARARVDGTNSLSLLSCSLVPSFDSSVWSSLALSFADSTTLISDGQVSLGSSSCTGLDIG